MYSSTAGNGSSGSNDVRPLYESKLRGMVGAEVGLLSRCYSQHAAGPDDYDAVDRCLGLAQLAPAELNKALEAVEHVWRR